MSKPPSLADRSKKELATLARRRGVAGYESMGKEALVKALLRTASKPARPASKPAAGKAPIRAQVKAAVKRPAARPAKPSVNGTAKHAPAKPAAKPVVQVPAKLPVPAAKPPVRVEPPAVKPLVKYQSSVRVEAAIPADKDLSVKGLKSGIVKDRIVLTAPDPFWLHAFWELSVQSVQRAEAALGQDWPGAKPIIRLFDVTSTDTTSTSEAPLRDIVVHGGCSHWYIDVAQPPRSYRADIGYLARSGRFFVLARSNVVSPPKAGASEALEEGVNGNETRANVAHEPDPMAQARELLDEQFRRPMKDTPFGSGAVLPGKLKKFFFDIDAELIVYGKTDPTASVTLQNEQVKLRPDGTFTMRFSLPDSRQIIPAVATSSDGMEEQTIVLAVERNTKRLDPMIHDLYGDGN